MGGSDADGYSSSDNDAIEKANGGAKVGYKSQC